MTGKFITLEGPEGSGKTTVSKELVKILNESGYKVLLTREPGGVDIAEQIRNVILDKKNIRLKFRGSENQRIIDMKKSKSEKSLVLWDES